MKKKIYFFTSLLLGLVGLYFLSSFILGVIFSKEYRYFLDTLSLNSKIKIEIIKYERHWFNSVAVLKLNLPLTENYLIKTRMPAKSLAMVVKQEIKHGPLFLIKNPPSNSKLFFGQAVISSELDQSPENKIKTLISLNGNMQTKIAWPSTGTSKQTSNASYEIKNLSGILNLTHHAKHLQGEFHCENLKILTDRTQQQFHNIMLFQQLNKNKHGFWTGQKIVTIGSVLYKNQDRSYLIQEFDYQLSTYILNQKLHALIDTKIKNLKIDDVLYGPQHITLLIHHIDVGLLKQLVYQLALLQIDLENEHQFQKLNTTLLALLNKGIQMKVDNLILNTSFGQVLGKLEADLKPDTPIQSFSQIIPNINGKISLQIPALLTYNLMTGFYQSSASKKQTSEKIAEDRIAEWIKQGWLELLGTDYWIHLQFKKQQISIDKEPSLQPNIHLISGNTLTVNL